VSYDNPLLEKAVDIERLQFDSDFQRGLRCVHKEHIRWTDMSQLRLLNVSDG